MTQLIDKSDPRYFSQSCYKPYDRHKYKLFYASGKIETYEWYDEVMARWMQTPAGHLSHVEVMDRKSKYR
jgi:hypothetical protein